MRLVRGLPAAQGCVLRASLHTNSMNIKTALLFIVCCKWRQVAHTSSNVPLERASTTHRRAVGWAAAVMEGERALVDWLCRLVRLP